MEDTSQEAALRAELEFSTQMIRITTELLTREEQRTYPYHLLTLLIYTMSLSWAGVSLQVWDLPNTIIGLLLCPFYHWLLTFLMCSYGKYPGACIGLVLPPTTHYTLKLFVEKEWRQVFDQLSTDTNFASLKVDKQGFETTCALTMLWKTETLKRFYYWPFVM